MLFNCLIQQRNSSDVKKDESIPLLVCNNHVSEDMVYADK